jgi:hypothetical protein
MKKQFILSLLVLLLGINISLDAEDFIFKSSTDLNGDNKPEEISLTNIDETTEFYLEISGKKIQGKFDEEPSDGFIIIDIDKHDKYKEIAVHTPGPSSDDEYFIYWYDGEAIQKTAHLSRWPKFLGNGIVYVDGWLGFWSRRDKYVLNNSTRELEKVPQFAYYVGVKATVKNSFPIFKDKELTEKVASLSKNSEIEILLCDMENKTWKEHIYLIKSKSNLIGWASNQDIYNNLEGLPLAD